MIEVQNLVKNYGSIPIIQNISFNVQKGEVLGFLGPNGAGKSTTMKILTCFMPQTSGLVKICGMDNLNESIKIKEKLGYLPENCPLYMDMTVSEYLKFTAEAKKIPYKEIKGKVLNAMEDVSITSVSNKLISKLSKGYRQRIGLAQAIINDPEVLILDEPTVGLDPKQIIEIRELIKNMAGKRTVILSTHILPEVSVTCQRVVIINKGKVVAEDTPSNLTKNLKNSIEIYLKAEGDISNIILSLRNIDGVKNVKFEKTNSNIVDFIIESDKSRDIRKDIASTIIRNDWNLYEMYKKEVSLEDIFLQLVTQENQSNNKHQEITV